MLPETTIYMATSLNGQIARPNGEEDFLPNDGWVEMIELAKQHGHLIWGRKTYEAVQGYEGRLRKDIDSIPVILVTSNDQEKYPSNVTTCDSPEKALKLVEEMGHEHGFLAGGPTLNTSFIEQNLVDEIILDINPVLIGRGISLLNNKKLEKTLKLVESKSLKKGIVRLHYSVLNKVE